MEKQPLRGTAAWLTMVINLLQISKVRRLRAT